MTITQSGIQKTQTIVLESYQSFLKKQFEWIPIHKDDNPIDAEIKKLMLKIVNLKVTYNNIRNYIKDRNYLVNSISKKYDFITPIMLATIVGRNDLIQLLDGTDKSLKDKPFKDKDGRTIEHYELFAKIIYAQDRNKILSENKNHEVCQWYHQQSSKIVEKERSLVDEWIDYIKPCDVKKIVDNLLESYEKIVATKRAQEEIAAKKERAAKEAIVVKKAIRARKEIGIKKTTGIKKAIEVKRDGIQDKKEAVEIRKAQAAAVVIKKEREDKEAIAAAIKETIFDYFGTICDTLHLAKIHSFSFYFSTIVEIMQQLSLYCIQSELPDVCNDLFIKNISFVPKLRYPSDTSLISIKLSNHNSMSELIGFVSYLTQRVKEEYRESFQVLRDKVLVEALEKIDNA